MQSKDEVVETQSFVDPVVVFPGHIWALICSFFGSPYLMRPLHCANMKLASVLYHFQYECCINMEYIVKLRKRNANRIPYGRVTLVKPVEVPYYIDDDEDDEDETDTSIDDDDLPSFFSRIKHVQALSIPHEASIHHISFQDFTNLKHLSIYEDFVSYLKKMKNSQLVSLVITCRKPKYQGFNDLIDSIESQKATLQKLQIINCNLRKSAIEMLLGFNSLISLELSEGYGIEMHSSAALQTLVDKGVNISFADISLNGKVVEMKSCFYDTRPLFSSANKLVIINNERMLNFLHNYKSVARIVLSCFNDTNFYSTLEDSLKNSPHIKSVVFRNCGDVIDLAMYPTISKIATIVQTMNEEQQSPINVLQELEQQLPDSVPFTCGEVISSTLFIVTEEQKKLAVTFPVTTESVKNLLPFCEKAPFGRKEETVLDETIRKCWQIDAKKLEFSAGMNETIGNMISLIEKSFYGKNLDVEPPRKKIKYFKVTPYKMLIYEEGFFFKDHKDTIRSEDHIATVVLLLPSEFTGGDLVLKFSNDNHFKFNKKNFVNDDCTTMSFVAFPTETLHCVEPIQSGVRACITFNVFSNKKIIPESIPLYHQCKKQLVEAIWNVFSNSCRPVVFKLSHQYSPSTLRNLIGRDMHLYSMIPKHMFSVQIISIKFEGTFLEEEDMPISFTCCGNCEPFQITFVSDNDMHCSHYNFASKLRMSDLKSRTIETGNDGTQIEFQYSSCLMVIKPK